MDGPRAEELHKTRGQLRKGLLDKLLSFKICTDSDSVLRNMYVWFFKYFLSLYFNKTVT